MIDLREDCIFRDNVIDLLKPENFCFLKHFDSHKLAGSFLLCKSDSPKRA